MTNPFANANPKELLSGMTWTEKEEKLHIKLNQIIDSLSELDDRAKKHESAYLEADKIGDEKAKEYAIVNYTIDAFKITRYVRKITKLQISALNGKNLHKYDDLTHALYRHYGKYIENFPPEEYENFKGVLVDAIKNGKKSSNGKLTLDINESMQKTIDKVSMSLSSTQPSIESEREKQHQSEKARLFTNLKDVKEPIEPKELSEDELKQKMVKDDFRELNFQQKAYLMSLVAGNDDDAQKALSFRMNAMLKLAEDTEALSDEELQGMGYDKAIIQEIIPQSEVAKLKELKQRYEEAGKNGNSSEKRAIGEEMKAVRDNLINVTESNNAFSKLDLQSQLSDNKGVMPETKDRGRQRALSLPFTSIKFKLDEDGVNIEEKEDTGAKLYPSNYKAAIALYKKGRRSEDVPRPIDPKKSYSEAVAEKNKTREDYEDAVERGVKGKELEKYAYAAKLADAEVHTRNRRYNDRVTTMINSELTHINRLMSVVDPDNELSEKEKMEYLATCADTIALRFDCFLKTEEEIAKENGGKVDRDVVLSNFMTKLSHGTVWAGYKIFNTDFGKGASTHAEVLLSVQKALINSMMGYGDVEGGNGFDKETGRARDSYDARNLGHLSPGEKATADDTNTVNSWKNSGAEFRALMNEGYQKGRFTRYAIDGNVINKRKNTTSFLSTQGLFAMYVYGISGGRMRIVLDHLSEVRKDMRKNPFFKKLKDNNPWNAEDMDTKLQELGAKVLTRQENLDAEDPFKKLETEGKTYDSNKGEFDAVIKDLGEDYDMYLAQSARPVKYGNGDIDGDYSRSAFKFNDETGEFERVPDSFTDRGSVVAVNKMNHILRYIEGFNKRTGRGPTTEEFAREHTGQFEVPSEYTEIRADDELKDDDDFMDSIFKPGEKKHMANRQIYSYPKMWEGNHMLVNPGKIRDMIGKDVSGLGGTLGENVRTSKPYEYKEKNEEKKLDDPEVPEKVPKRSILQQREPKDNSSFDAYDSQNGEAAYNELTNDGRSLDDYYKSVGNKLITTDKDGKIKKIYTYDPKSKTFSIASEFLEGKDDMRRMAFSGYHHNNNNSDKYEYSSEHYTPGNPDSRFKLIMKPVTITTKDGSEKTVLSPIMMPVEKTLDGGFMPVEGVKGTYISSKDMRAYKDDVKHSVNRLNDARAYKASRDANFGADIDDALSDDPTKRNAWAQSIDKLIQSGKGDEVPPGARALFFSGEVDHDYLKNYPDNSANYEKAIKEFREGKHPDEFAEDIKLTATPLTRKESKQHRDEVKERHMQVEGTPAIEEEAPPVAEPKSKTKKKPAKTNTSDKEKKPTEKKTQSTKTKEVKEPKVKTEVTVDDKNKTEPESSTKTETPETAKPSVDPSVKTEKVKKTGKVKKPISTSKSSTDKMSFTKSTEQPCVGTAKMGTGKDAIDMKPVKGKTSGDEGSKKTMKEIPSFKKMMQDKAESKFKKFGDCMNNEPEKADNSIAASADESFAESTPIDTPTDAPMGAPMGDTPMGDAPMGDAPMGDAPMGDAPMGDAVSDMPIDDAPIEGDSMGEGPGIIEDDMPEGDIPDETPQTPEELVSHWKEEGLDQNPELIQAALDQLKGESAPVEEDIAIEESIPEEEPKGHEDVPEKEDEPEKKEDKKDDEEPIKKSAPAIPSFKEMLARKH